MTVYRVIKSSGEVSGSWSAENQKLSQTVDEVREKLKEEEVRIDPESGKASPKYRWKDDDWPDYPGESFEAGGGERSI